MHLLYNLRVHLLRITGVDLTEVPGVDCYTALKLISEIGLDMNRWKTSKQFASWLGLCPDNRISGGKILSTKSKRTKNRAAASLRLAAWTLNHSHCALGAFLRRMKSRVGAPKAVTATAHKLAVIIFNMLKNKVAYVEIGQNYYEEQYKSRTLKNLKTRAKELGFELKEISLNSGLQGAVI